MSTHRTTGAIAGSATQPRCALALDFVIVTDVPGLAAYLDRAFSCLPEAQGPPQEFGLFAAGAGSSGADRSDDTVGYVVFSPTESPIEVASASAAVPALVSALNRAVIEAATSSDVLVHASAVQAADGVVLFPAAPTSGKSTLAAGLTRRGARYLTDELVAVDPATATVRTYPRPLSLKRGSWAVLPELRPDVDAAMRPFLEALWLVAPDAIRAGPMAEGGRVIGVAFPCYVADAATTLAPRSRADALQGLVEACFNLAHWGRDGFEILAALVPGADCTSLTVGDLETACDLLDDRYAILECHDVRP